MRKKSLAATLCVVVALAGCSGTPTGKTEQANYTLFGLAEKNLSTETDYLYLEFRADGNAVPGSFARVGNDTMYFDSWGIIDVSSPAVAWQYSNTVVVTVYDTSRNFAHTLTERMPGDVTIAHFIPTTHIYQGGNVTVRWMGTPVAAGYLVTCVARTDYSFARGFAENYGNAVSEVTIGPETFLDRYDDERVADSFYVYVTAYNPTFERRPFVKYTDTPEIYELDFPNSITGANITGIFGTAVVSQGEAFDVVAQD